MLITLNNSLDEVFDVVNKYSKESEMMEEDFYLIPTTVIEQETHTDSTKVCLNIAIVHVLWSPVQVLTRIMNL